MRILFLALTFISSVLTQTFAADTPAPVDTKHTIHVAITKADFYTATVDDKGNTTKITAHNVDSNVKIFKSDELKNVNEEDLKKSVIAAIKKDPSQDVATLAKDYSTLDNVASGAIGVVSTVGGIIGSFAPKLLELAAFL